MESEYKQYKHNPPHLFVPNAKYFITASTYKKKPFLITVYAKDKLYKSLQIEFTKYHWVIEDWVILDNHYHLMVNASENSSELPQIIKEVHRFTALWIKKNVPMECANRLPASVFQAGVSAASKRMMQPKEELTRLIHSTEKIFYNYWDTCITFDNSYFTRLNYIWFNPVKHGYVENPEDWKFGSYYYRFQKEADDLKSLKKKYPFDKVKVKDDF